MAKPSTPKSGGTSKFRMVVIDAELQEGEISQLAQAIQGAFGGQRVTTVRLNGPPARSLPSPELEDISPELHDDEVLDDTEELVLTPVSPKVRVQKKIRTPDLDKELHPEMDPPLKAYADARNVTAGSPVMTKFLVVASWLHEERSEMPITADRAFTCFRFVKWSFGIDFDQPLRDLKRKKFLEQKGKGEFLVTHLGLDHATKLAAASRDGT